MSICTAQENGQAMSLSMGVLMYRRLGIETPGTESSSPRDRSLLQPQALASFFRKNRDGRTDFRGWGQKAI